MNERPIQFDYHTHTIEHGLAKPRRVREIVQAALDKGLSTICLTDHYPLPPGYEDPTDEKDCAMVSANYPIYQQEVTQAIEEFGDRINIRRGAEMDWFADYAQWTRQEVSRWPFDYVMGSVHFIGRIADSLGERNFLLDYKEEEFQRGLEFVGGIEPLARSYYSEVQAMVRSGIFDGVGHLDLVKKYNDGSLFSGDEPWYRKIVADTLDAVAQSGMSIEINTAGLDKKCHEAYPSLWILQEARVRSIPLIISSDGHVPEIIGKNLDKAVVLAKDSGYDYIVEYRNRQRTSVQI